MLVMSFRLPLMWKQEPQGPGMMETIGLFLASSTPTRTRLGRLSQLGSTSSPLIIVWRRKVDNGQGTAGYQGE